MEREENREKWIDRVGEVEREIGERERRKKNERMEKKRKDMKREREEREPRQTRRFISPRDRSHKQTTRVHFQHAVRSATVAEDGDSCRAGE